MIKQCRSCPICDICCCLTAAICSINPLMDRFEFPMDKNRWDSPLFTVVTNLLAETGMPASTETSGVSGIVSPAQPLSITDAGTSSSAVQPKTTASSWKAKPKKKSSDSDAASSLAKTALTANNYAQSNTLTSFTIPEVPSTNTSAVTNPPQPAEDATESLVEPAVALRATALSMSGNSQPTVARHEHTAESACEAVWQYLQTATVAAPNSSTVPVPHAAPDLLYMMTQTVNGMLAECRI
jgi:hypothetical protein